MKRDLLPLADFDEVRETKRFYNSLLDRLEDIDLVDILASIGIRGMKQGRELQIRCPVHGGHDGQTCHVHVEGDKKGLWYCFSPKCHNGGFVTTLLRHALGISYVEALVVLGIKVSQNIFHDVDELSERIERAVDIRSLTKDWICDESITIKNEIFNLDKTIPLPFYNRQGLRLKALRVNKVWNYLHNARDFKDRHRTLVMPANGIIESLNIAYCDKNESSAFGERVIFPIKTLAEINPVYSFFLGRSVNKYQQPKVRYPYGAPTSLVFMGEEQIPKRWTTYNVNHGLYLVEGPIDWLRMYSFGIASLCCFSANLTSAQTTRLLKILKLYPFEKIVIAFDGDLAGWMGAVDAVEKLAPFVPVEMLQLPEGTDPCDFTDPEEFLALPRTEISDLHVSSPHLKISS